MDGDRMWYKHNCKYFKYEIRIYAIIIRNKFYYRQIFDFQEESILNFKTHNSTAHCNTL